MGALALSKKEQDRLDVLSRVKRKEITVVRAAELLKVSVRQARRINGRFKSAGAEGLAHGLRGRTSNNRIDDDKRDRIIKLHQEHFRDFGHTHACEKLAEMGLVVSPDTLVNLLKQRGLYVPMRSRGKHRKRRPRRACFGEMIQCDGSEHDWFEGKGPKATLMDLIDDATGLTWARFYPAETTEAAFDAFERWSHQHGICRAFYVDRHTIYRNNERPEKPTQFARAMNELGVELIFARSPQAKGRVERRHALFQNRLVKEMRLRRLRTIEQANAYLDQVFLPAINRRYAVSASKSEDLHRPVPANLEQILCRQEPRTVGRDWCVAWDGRVLQIDAAHAPLKLPGRRITVRHLRDGRLLLEHQGHRLTFVELPARPTPAKPKKVIVNNKPSKPAPTHPWGWHVGHVASERRRGDTSTSA